MFLFESFRFGSRTVTMQLSEPPTNGVLALECAWFPDPPSRLNRGARRQYRRGRHKFMTKLSKKTGERVMVVDL